MSNEIKAKVTHVTNTTQTRIHECHWPTCKVQVPPAMWGCRNHWYKLPKSLRDKIWETYRIGQEIDGDPSLEYLEVMKEVQKWIWLNHGVK
jgi:hypothetical protein